MVFESRVTTAIDAVPSTREMVRLGSSTFITLNPLTPKTFPVPKPSYASFRRPLFDSKADLPPTSFRPTFEHLVKAASAIGPIDGLAPMPRGSFHALYRFGTPDGMFVLKVPMMEELGDGLLVADHAAQLAHAADFPALVPVLTDTSRYLAPFAFQILPFVEGRGSQLPNLQRLHDIHLRGFGPLDLLPPGEQARGMLDSWESYLTTKLADHLEACIQQGDMTQAEAFQADEIIRRARFEFVGSLLHNDLSNANIIGETVIDWESALVGDPVWDLAGRAAFFQDQPVDTGLLAMLSGIKPHEFNARFWTYYLRIVIARTVHRARFGIQDQPGRPKASSRIQLALSRLS